MNRLSITVSDHCLDRFASMLGRLLGCSHKPKPRIVFNEIRIQSTVIKGRIMGFKLPHDKQFRVAIQPQDAAGNPALVQGAPVWSVGGDVALVTLAVSADGMSALVRPNDAGMLGSCQINVAADADLGDGVETITGFLDVDVVGGKAVALQVSTGALEPLTPLEEPQTISAGDTGDLGTVVGN